MSSDSSNPVTPKNYMIAVHCVSLKESPVDITCTTYQVVSNLI